MTTFWNYMLWLLILLHYFNYYCADVEANKETLQAARLPTILDSPFATRSGQFSCGTIYLGASYICDPGRYMSRSEAEEIEQKVAAVGLCTCEFQNNSSAPEKMCSRTASFGLAIMKNVYLPQIRMQQQQYIESIEDVDLPDNFFHQGSYIGHIYADIVREKWSTEHCPLDIMVLAVTWHTTNPYLNNRFYIYASFGPRIQLQATFVPPIALIDLQRPERPLTLRVLDFLSMVDTVFRSSIPDTQVAKALESLYRHPGQGSLLNTKPWPVWALLVFAGCILVSIAAVACSSLTQQSHRQRYFVRNSNVSIRMANKRWRAGFAGGVFGREDGGAPKKSIGNAMMFSRFNRPKTMQSGTTSYV